MNIQTMTVYYLTGTGNSFRVACWMTEQAETCGIGARTIAMEASRTEGELKAGAEHLLGLVFPVHGFTAPWYVIRFVLSLPRREKVRAFVAVPRGATKFGCSRVFPGMEGTSGYLIALILVLKGYTVQGVTGLDMPSNWMSLHCSLSQANVKAVLSKAKMQTEQFLKEILWGNSYFNGISCLLAGVFLAPLSVLYLVLGRFYLSKLFFASNACTGCGVCVQNCPIGAVVMRGCKKPRPYWTFSCESCMRCMGYCPEKAVEAGHSLGAIFYFITTIPATNWLFNQVGGFLPGAECIQAGWVHNVAQYLYILVSLWLSYYLFHWLSKVPLINWLFTWTTLTHLYDRYHEPGTKAEDFKSR